MNIKQWISLKYLTIIIDLLDRMNGLTGCAENQHGAMAKKISCLLVNKKGPVVNAHDSKATRRRNII